MTKEPESRAEAGLNHHDNPAKDRVLLSTPDHLILEVTPYSSRSKNSSKETGLFSSLNILLMVSLIDSFGLVSKPGVPRKYQEMRTSREK